MFLYYRL